MCTNNKKLHKVYLCRLREGFYEKFLSSAVSKDSKSLYCIFVLAISNWKWT